MSLSMTNTSRALFWSTALWLLRSERVRSMDQYTQHGDTSCLIHSMAVAYYSLLLADVLHLSCNRDSLVRGALLHDYFLYDWHEKDASHRLHGFTHPGRALRNARKDYGLNAIECDIIARHMFPLVPLPPRGREAVLVCLVDKVCSLYETVHFGAYHSISYRKSRYLSQAYI